jgi:type I restriction enzyme S subunit
LSTSELFNRTNYMRVRLVDVCSLVTERVPIGSPARLRVDLEHIEPNTGLLTNEELSATPEGTRTGFQRDDILFGKLRPYLRKTHLSTADGECSTEIWVLRPRVELVNPRYLHCVLRSQAVQRLANATAGTKMPRADWEHVSEAPIALPPRATQDQIADADLALERTGRLLAQSIAAKREQKRGLMQQLLTGKVRFPGFTEPWKPVPLKSMITLESPGAWGDAPTNADPGVVVLRSTNITDDGRIELTSTVNRSLEPRKRAALLIRSGDILLERSGGTDTRPVGRVAFARTDIDACYSNFLQRLRPDKTAVNPYFLFLQLIRLHASGATNRLQAQTTGIRNLMYRAYLECPLPLPEPDEQARICDALNAATSEIELLVNQREAFASQRRGLMERLLSGEVDIPSSDTFAA